MRRQYLKSMPSRNRQCPWRQGETKKRAAFCGTPQRDGFLNCLLLVALCLTAIGLPAASASGAWTTPQMILAQAPGSSNWDDISVALDSNGDWHMVYGWVPVNPKVTYMNSDGAHYDLAVDGARCPSIAVDSDDGLHVMYWTWDAIMYTNSKNLVVGMPLIWILAPLVLGSGLAVTMLSSRRHSKTDSRPR